MARILMPFKFWRRLLCMTVLFLPAVLSWSSSFSYCHPKRHQQQQQRSPFVGKLCSSSNSKQLGQKTIIPKNYKLNVSRSRFFTPLRPSLRRLAVKLQNQEKDDDNDRIVMDDNNTGKKKMRNISLLKKMKWLTKGYQLSSMLFGVVGLLILFMPDRTLTKQLASKLGGASGFGVAAYLCWMLQTETTTKTKTKTKTTITKSPQSTSTTTTSDSSPSLLAVSSSAWKRSNLGLLGFSVLGLIALPGEAGFWPSAGPAVATAMVMTLARMVGAVVALAGWLYSVNDESSTSATTTPATTTTSQQQQQQGTTSPLLSLAFKDLFWNGTKHNLLGLSVWKANKKKSLFYRNALLLMLFGVFSSFMEAMFGLRYMDALSKSSFEISLQFSGAARLLLLSSIVFSLKEAAEEKNNQQPQQGVVSSTIGDVPFISMNFMVGIWALMVGIGQAMVPMGFQVKNGKMMAFSILFFLKGYKGLKTKWEKDGQTATAAPRLP